MPRAASRPQRQPSLKITLGGSGGELLKTFPFSAGLSPVSMRRVVWLLPARFSAPPVLPASVRRWETDLDHRQAGEKTAETRHSSRRGERTSWRHHPKPAASSAPNYTVPFIIVTALFGIFGFLTSLNNQLVGKLKEIFDLPYGPSMLATSAWFFAYLVFSVPSGKLIEKVGYKSTMVISLFIMVVGALLFVPAANQVSFPLTLTAIFVLASGVCALQTSANPYVAILGPESSASARLNLAQAFNSGASAMAGWFAATFILADTSKVTDAASQAHMLQMPYVYIAAGLLVLGITVMFLHLPADHLGPACGRFSGCVAAASGASRIPCWAWWVSFSMSA